MKIRSCDLAHKIGILGHYLVKGSLPRNSLVINLLMCGLTQWSSQVIKVMRRLKLDKIQQYYSKSPDTDWLLGMLRPLTTPVKHKSEASETLSFMRNTGCQMHTLVHFIPFSPEWHLSYLLKAFIVSRNVSLIVVSRYSRPSGHHLSRP